MCARQVFIEVIALILVRVAIGIGIIGPTDGRAAVIITKTGIVIVSPAVITVIIAVAGTAKANGNICLGRAGNRDGNDRC